MKVFISADIEGVAGITTADEANPHKAEIKYYQNQMTQEVVAACNGALQAGAKSLYVKDAHWLGTNIDPRALPKCARLVRGWTGHPYRMMAGLDDSFDAAVMVGYHARAGSGGNPLAHTLVGSLVAELRINQQPVSEFRINTLAATLEKVPVVFVSGDEALCQEVHEYNPAISSFATFRGIGEGTDTVHPEVALESIQEGVRLALENSDNREKMKPLPNHFHVEIDYMRPRQAYGYSFYPGAKLTQDKTVSFQTSDYFEALRFIGFCVP